MTGALRPAVRPLLTLAAALALGLTACAGGPDRGASSGEDDGDAGSGALGAAPSAVAEADGPLDLASVCPATVVMQQDWQPQSEHGAMYALVGQGYTIDDGAKSVTGPLIAQGQDTGVDVEVRPGGPNVGFQRVADLMYLDTDILIGAVNSDQSIVSQAAGRPVTAVTSQLTRSPQMLMWDPATYPEAETIADVAAQGATLLVGGDILPALLEREGLIEASQVDTSYQGTPERFVSDPSILQQGFGTSEPFVYENEITQWAKPVAFQYLHEIGYSIYPEPLAVREADLTAQADCLERLVPIMQQSQIDYLAQPEGTDELIVELVERYATSWTFSPELAAFSAAAQREDGLVFDDPETGVFGILDGERMRLIVDTFGPVLEADGSIPALADVEVERLYSNAFIDEDISMGVSAP